jgi:hypothetical protein
MASNFRVFIHRSGDSIHLKLLGGFDGSSAHELVNILDLYCDQAGKIFIHTGGLSSVHSFGKDIFQTKCAQYKNLVPKIVFTGDPGKELVLRGSRHIP